LLIQKQSTRRGSSQLCSAVVSYNVMRFEWGQQ